MNSQSVVYDIYDYYYPVWWKQSFGIALIIAGVLLLGGCIILFVWWKRRKALSPEEWGCREIGRLQPKNCVLRQDFKKFYFALTSLIKIYFHKRYGWDVIDKTDDEFVAFLETKPTHQAFARVFKQMMQGAIEVKFANVDVIRSQADQDWKSIESFFLQEKRMQPSKKA